MFSEGITAVAPSRETADQSGRVIVWDVESASPLVTLSNDADVEVFALDWSPEKKRISAGRTDGTVPIWKLPIVLE